MTIAAQWAALTHGAVREQNQDAIENDVDVYAWGFDATTDSQRFLICSDGSRTSLRTPRFTA